jgi:TolB-like protein/Flp pilus assembly protein TadD
MTLLTECGQSESAIEAGLRLLALDPLHEEAARRMMRLYGQTGRRGAAIQLYHSLAAALRAELDAQPEAETRAIFAEMSRGGGRPPHTDGPAASPAPPQSPSASMPRPSDAPREPRPPENWPAFRLRARGVILAGAVTAAVALLSFGGYALLIPRQGAEIERRAAASEAHPVSIAVLPFVNLSGDPGQDFFSDGMTEETTAALTKIPGLQVVARTSAFQFKGKSVDVKALGKQLNASYIIEGSVRRAGDRLRVTAQLVEASGGTHLWAESYDRELADIFAIQEDIARAIATSLLVPLGLNPGENLVDRSLDPKSYEQYLRAKQLVRARTAGAAEAIKILEPLLARNPGFAPGWAQLAQAYGAVVVSRSNASPEEANRISTEYGLKRVAAASRAIELDPNSAEGYWAQAQAQTQVQTIDELLSKALALDPNSPDVLNAYGQMLFRVGRLKEALSTFQRVQALEPFVPIYTGNLGEALWLNGQNDAALSLLLSGPRGPARAADVAIIYASMGRFGDAADTVLELPARNFPPELVADAARLLRTAPANSTEPQSLPRLASLGWIYLYVGAPMRALEFYEERDRNIAQLWHRSYAPVRKTERFKALVRKAGLVDYWRAKGWPEFCRPVGNDFACD